MLQQDDSMEIEISYSTRAYRLIQLHISFENKIPPEQYDNTHFEHFCKFNLIRNTQQVKKIIDELDNFLKNPNTIQEENVFSVIREQLYNFFFSLKESYQQTDLWDQIKKDRSEMISAFAVDSKNSLSNIVVELIKTINSTHPNKIVGPKYFGYSPSDFNKKKKFFNELLSKKDILLKGQQRTSAIKFIYNLQLFCTEYTPPQNHPQLKTHIKQLTRAINLIIDTQKITADELAIAKANPNFQPSFLNINPPPPRIRNEPSTNTTLYCIFNALLDRENDLLTNLPQDNREKLALLKQHFLGYHRSTCEEKTRWLYQTLENIKTVTAETPTSRTETPKLSDSQIIWIRNLQLFCDYYTPQSVDNQMITLISQLREEINLIKAFYNITDIKVLTISRKNWPTAWKPYENFNLLVDDVIKKMEDLKKNADNSSLPRFNLPGNFSQIIRNLNSGY